MKIDFISSLNDSNDIRIRKKFIESLLQKNFIVRYYCTKSPLDVEENENLEYVYHNKPKTKIERLVNIFKVTFKVITTKQEYIQICNPEFLPVALLKPIKTKTKLIFDMHEDFESTLMDKSKNKFLGVITSKLYKKFINFVMKHYIDYTFVTTPLIKEKFPYNNVFLVENYAPIIPVNFSKIETDFLLDPEKLNIIFTGLISEVRGVSKILEVISQDKQGKYKLYLLGKISDSYLEDLNNKYGSYFSYVESLPYDRMIDIIKIMDVGIIPYLPLKNHVVTRPNKLFEYMMCKVPVLGSNYPLYSDVIDQGCGLTMNIESNESIEDKLRTLYTLKHSDKLKLMGEKGYQLYKEKYNWPKEFEKIENIYI